MNPSDDMDISLFIEPQTGVILQALQLIQINVMVRRNPNFPELARLKNVTFLPIGYINTSIYVSESVAHTLMSTLIVPQMSIAVSASLMIAGALVSLIAATALFIHQRCFGTRRASGARGEENAPLIAECVPDAIETLDTEASPADSTPSEQNTMQAVGSEGDNEVGPV